MKRGRCDSDLCRARTALTKYLDDFLDERGLGYVDRERNTNYDILCLIYGNRLEIWKEGKETKEMVQESRLIPTNLFDVLIELCSHEEGETNNT
jgi:hypothetical protein